MMVLVSRPSLLTAWKEMSFLRSSMAAGCRADQLFLAVFRKYALAYSLWIWPYGLPLLRIVLKPGHNCCFGESGRSVVASKSSVRCGGHCGFFVLIIVKLEANAELRLPVALLRGV